MIRFRDTVLLCGLAAIGPFSIDTYVPVLPSMASELGVHASAVQLTLTSYLGGLLVGVVVAGVLSDAVGRRGPLLWGLVLYVVASLACAASPSVEVLIAARAVQAFGVAAATVIARAVVRDVTDGHAVTRVLSQLTLVQGLAPTVAPLLGSQLLHVTSWRGVFVFLAVAGAVLLSVSVIVLPESMRRRRHPRMTARWATMAGSYRLLGRDRRFLCYATAFAAAFGALFAYVSASPFVLQDLHGLSAVQFSCVYGVNGFGMILAGQFNARWVARLSEVRLLGAGLLACSGGGVASLVTILVDSPLWILLVALLVVVASLGLVMPNATSLAMQDHPDRAGAAFSLLTVVQLAVSAVASWMAGLGAGHQAEVSMTTTMALFAVLAALTFLCDKTLSYRKRGRQHDIASLP
ncbi:multidrug effflux MFS transporter [Amycolatopsis sacchari]|uniref:multidrug effflux MFS transporter n=1 Tax=Amycolatopsis sacchari TaxID=115433 RepID=UPI003EBF074F